jgi:hypothetical protein
MNNGITMTPEISTQTPSSHRRNQQIDMETRRTRGRDVSKPTTHGERFCEDQLALRGGEQHRAWSGAMIEDELSSCTLFMKAIEEEDGEEERRQGKAPNLCEGSYRVVCQQVDSWVVHPVAVAVCCSVMTMPAGEACRAVALTVKA